MADRCGRSHRSCFPGLTLAERVLLDWADVTNVERWDYAEAPANTNPILKPSTHFQTIRPMTRRMRRSGTDSPADRFERDKSGGKIVGKLNLSEVKVPFAITLRRCSIPELMGLSDAEMRKLDLNGSYTGPIRANDIDVVNATRLGLGRAAARARSAIRCSRNFRSQPWSMDSKQPRRSTRQRRSRRLGLPKP
jgi:hypothetical protein